MIAWGDSFLLAILAAAAMLHLNASRVRWWERIGFALVAGGAFGVMASHWWPEPEELSTLILHGGLAVIAASMVRGEIADLIRGRVWNGRDRRHRERLSAREFVDRRFGKTR